MERMGARGDDDDDEVVRVHERNGEEASARGDDFRAARVHEFDRGKWTSSGAVRVSLSKVITTRKYPCDEDDKAVRVHEQDSETVSVRRADCEAKQVHECIAIRLLFRSTNEAAIFGRRKGTQVLG